MKYTLLFALAFFLNCSCHAQYFNESPKHLTKTEVDNLVAFARLYGYVRFFHPSDKALVTDWDLFAINGVKAMESAKDSVERLEKLNMLFNPVAPLMKIDWTSQIKAPKFKHTGKTRYWLHRGYGEETDKWQVYSSTVKTTDVESRDAKSPHPDSLFRAELPGNISIMMPVALYVTTDIISPKEKKQPPDYSASNRSVRFADVIITWNILKHFYPYWEVTPVDWDLELVKYLERSSLDSTATDFKKTLQYMIADLQDGHGQAIYFKVDPKVEPSNLPIELEWIENKIVVTDCENCDALGIKRGDILKTLNGEDVMVRVTELGTRISSATEPFRHKRILDYLLRWDRDSTFTLQLENAEGKLYEKKLLLTKWNEIDHTRDEKITELKNGIYYVNLGKIEMKDFKKALPELKTAKGIIFDNRCYPLIEPDYLSYLSEGFLRSARWMIPVITYPDAAPVEYDTSGRWLMPPLKPYLSCPKVFLTNAWAISYAESVMGIVEAYKLGEIVGEPTAGTNGNINRVTLPGGYAFIFTGMKVLKHDGSQHHRVGIQPTIPCSKTIQGVREGRDEQLEKAIEVIEKRL